MRVEQKWPQQILEEQHVFIEAGTSKTSLLTGFLAVVGDGRQTQTGPPCWWFPEDMSVRCFTVNRGVNSQLSSWSLPFGVVTNK